MPVGRPEAGARLVAAVTVERARVVRPVPAAAAAAAGTPAVAAGVAAGGPAGVAAVVATAAPAGRTPGAAPAAGLPTSTGPTRRLPPMAWARAAAATRRPA